MAPSREERGRRRRQKGGHRRAGGVVVVSGRVREEGKLQTVTWVGPRMLGREGCAVLDHVVLNLGKGWD